MMDYEVRLAKQTDLAVLPEIEKAAAQLFGPYLEWLGISADVLEGLTTSGFLIKAQADSRLWVAAIAQKPVGFIVAKFLPDCCFIVELDVHPRYGRMGIGSALVKACCRSAQHRGFDQVLLTTFRRVPWNIPFYQRLGFEVLPARLWSAEIQAIVRHEACYGFAPEKRAVMRGVMPRAVSLEDGNLKTWGAAGWAAEDEA